jgi:uncharacterized protein (DUF362 family)
LQIKKLRHRVVDMSAKCSHRSNRDVVYVYNFKENNGIENTVRLILDNLQWEKIITGDKPVYIKLNLSAARPETFDYANTDKNVLRAVLGIITRKTGNIFLIESDLQRGNKKGGFYGGGTAEEMFRVGGIDKIAGEFGVTALSLSNQEQVFGVDPLLEDFGFPKCLLDENKVFVTMPLIKTHALTRFTGALKNQWGCVPRWDRILLHKNLNELIILCNKLIKPDLVIMGGRYAMEGRGPTSGESREFPVLVGSAKPASADAVAAELIGLDPAEIKHISLASSDLLGYIDLRRIQIIGSFEKNKTCFKPANLDWVLKWVNYLSRYKFFVYHILQNNLIFRTAKFFVQFLRKLGIVR